MMNSTVLTPVEVSRKYLNSELLIKRVTETFNVFKINEILNNISFPNAPFKNTAHGFIFLKEGEVKMLLNQEQFTFKSNTLVITPAGQMNNFVDISQDSNGYIGTFDQTLLPKDTNGEIKANVGEMLSSEQLPHFKLDAATFDLLYQMIIRVWELNHSTYKSKRLLIDSYLWSILLELQAFFRTNHLNPKSRSEVLVMNFKKLLLTQINHHPKPNDFAKMLNVSTNHLNKVLKMNTKKTTSQWIREQQILEAKYLLSYSSQSIAEIAYSLGFSQPSYFSKFFYQQVQITPSEYRND